MKINEDYKIVIIGAGTAGLSAAIYAQRAGQDVIILDGKGYGGQIGSTDRVENYPGIASVSGFDFATGLYEQAKSLGAKIKFSAVKSVEPTDTGFDVVTDRVIYKTGAVIIATGLEKRKLNLDKEEILTGKGVSYCATCDGAFYKGKNVAVVGGGNTALEDALFLSEYCTNVYLVHRRDEYRGEQTYIDEIANRDNIIQLKSYIPVEIEGTDRVEGFKVKNLKDDSVKTLDVSGVFAAVGQVPSNDIFKGLVELDSAGYVVAGEDCLTSTKGIFVAGDCRTKEVRQLVTAAADGAVAGIAAAKYVRNR